MPVVLGEQIERNLARWAELRAADGRPVDLEELHSALDNIVEFYRPTKLYLFGSLAQGDFDAASDLDMLIIVPDEAEGERRKVQHAYDLKRGVNASMDIIVTSASRFEGQRNWVNGLAGEVFRTGKLLHSGQPATSTAEEPSAMVPENFEEQAQSWLKSAASNLRVGDTVLALDPPEPVLALGHAEQCCERCCKALLAGAGRHVPHTHELPKLWEEVAQAGLTPSLELAEAQFISKLQQLHRYGAENLELDELPVADAERAMDIARACSEATRLALPA